MTDAKDTSRLVPIVHYSEAEQAARDVARLEELGLHPVIRKPGDGESVPPDADTDPAKDLVICVPQAEARAARETLDISVEAQGDARDGGYD